MQETTILRPWVELNKEKKGLPGLIDIKQLGMGEGECKMLAILGVHKNQLGLISRLKIEESTEQDSTIVYLSDQCKIKQQTYRIVYVPPSRQDQDSMQHLSDTIKNLSSVIVSDVNSGVHRIREGCQGNGMHFVVVNQNDIYEAGIRTLKIQLLRKLETPLFESLSDDLQVEGVHFGHLDSALRTYQQQWGLLASGEKAYSLLNKSILNSYIVRKRVESDFQKMINLKGKDMMMSISEIQLLQDSLIEGAEEHSPQELEIFREAVQNITKQIRGQNKSKQTSFLTKMQQQVLKGTTLSFQELTSKKQQIVCTLKSYGIAPQYAQFVVFSKEKELFEAEISLLYSEKQKLAEQTEACRQKVAQKNNQIDDFKTELDVYSDKLADLISLEQSFEKIQNRVGYLEEENSHFRQQISSLTSSNEQGAAQIKQLGKALQFKEIESLKLIECLQQLTEKSSQIQIENETQVSELEELKAQLSRNCQIQSRALRSIQNESDVRNRLERYCNYVKQLKTGLSSFKRMQSQKFNFMLSKNQQQHKRLQKDLLFARKEVGELREANKQLQISLQREKHRMSYIQRFIGDGVGHGVIAEVSQEDSLTDRELSAS